MDCKNLKITNPNTNWYKIFIFFVCILCSLIGMSQNNNLSAEISSAGQNTFKTISFGETISFGTIDSSSSWTIVNKAQNIFVALSGNEINRYLFDKTGIYEIHFAENKKHSEECNHQAFNEKMIIEVTSVKMTFDFSHIKFSEKIKSGVNYQDLIITVPVNVVVKDNKKEKYKIQEFTVAGIGSDLKATPLQKELILTTGQHIIKYKLSGIVKNATYLMFDFIDFNKNVQTYNQSEIVN